MEINKKLVKIYITNGMSGCGKDTFAGFINKYLTSHKEFFRKLSCVDSVKEACLKIGWDGKRDEKGRKLISDVNLALEAYNNSPLKSVLDKIEHEYKEYGYIYYFVDIREPYRIDKFKEMCEEKGYKVKTIFISRKDNKPILSNAGDVATLEPCDYDYYIENNETLKELEVKAIDFVDKHML